jgi:tetratricopeptide (TPR) repeat protein
MPYAVAFIMLIAMVACFWRLHRRAGKVNIAAALFMLALLPGLLSPVHAQTITVMSEHYLYFPMIGIALLAFLSMEKIAPKIQSSKSRILGLVGLFGILAFLSLSTFKQTDMWQDSATLFTSVRKVYPRSVAVLTNLGTAYAQIGMYGEAESVLRQAIGIDPEATQARFNYAGLRYVKGNYAGAIEEYKRVLESVPLDQDALRMLTWSYFRIGDIRNAEETYDTVIHLNPTLRSQLPRLDDPPPEQGDM